VSILSAAVTLLLLMDPVGNAPVFSAVLGDLPPARRRLAVARELGFALLILLGFLVFGRHLMAALGITQPALSLAGGVVLFIVALRMIFPGRHGGIAAEEATGDPWLVPLAVPLIAGPSAMAWVMLLASSEPDRLWDWVAAVLIAWTVTAAGLMAAGWLLPHLKQRGIRALERLMGMVLIVIALQMLLDGVARFLSGLPGPGAV